MNKKKEHFCSFSRFHNEIFNISIRTILADGDTLRISPSQNHYITVSRICQAFPRNSRLEFHDLIKQFPVSLPMPLDQLVGHSVDSPVHTHRAVVPLFDLP